MRSAPKLSSKYIRPPANHEEGRKWFEYSAHPPLVRTHKKLCKEWHPTKNGNLSPAEFTFGSNEKVWWKCSKCSHSWCARVEDRAIKESGCPACAGKVATSKTSLKAKFPIIAAEWHPTRNAGLTPSQVTPKSNYCAVWICREDNSHGTWTATVANRTSGTRCPFCAGSRPSRTYSLASEFPELAKEWWPDRNGALTPHDVTPGSTKVVWWKCPEGPDHEWQTAVANRTKTGKGCGFCHGLRVSATNSLRAVHPELAKQWHKRLNGSLTPDNVVARSQKKVWWRCAVNRTHVWQARIQDRVQKNSGCRECAGLEPRRPER